jgi:hypothetical protein
MEGNVLCLVSNFEVLEHPLHYLLSKCISTDVQEVFWITGSHTIPELKCKSEEGVYEWKVVEGRKVVELGWLFFHRM